MIARGVMPEGTQLTPLNPYPEDVANPADYVRPWDSLNADEKRLFCRMAEVFAGYSEYTDAQIGRVIDYLEETGQLENTLIFYAADKRVRHAHGVWHVFVMAGSAAHFMALLLYVAPRS